MERLKNDFLNELSSRLGNYKEKESILADYSSHLDEMFAEIGERNEDEAKSEIYSRLGSPDEIATVWKDELAVTPSNMKWLFITLNIVFFIGGSTLTAVHNLYDWEWIGVVWDCLTSIPVIISFVYMFFWALLGYEIGRSFGHKGKTIVRKTFLLALIPNLSLMLLTVIGIIPHQWFEPLLTKTFIAACIIFTAFLYPISLLGYKWGRKASV